MPLKSRIERWLYRIFRQAVTDAMRDRDHALARSAAREVGRSLAGRPDWWASRNARPKPPAPANDEPPFHPDNIA